MKKSLILIHLGLVAGIIFTFQNCAQPLEFQEDEIASAADGHPFGYNVKMDTIAYMSCSGQARSSFNSQAIFSFKIGAYNTQGSGVGLSEEFLASEAAELKASDQVRSLQMGKNSRGAQLQFIVRNPKDLLGRWFADATTGSGGEPDLGKDFVNILAPLDSSGLLNSLVAKAGEKVSYFGNLSGTQGRRIEGSLYFNDTEDVANTLRRDLDIGSGILSMNFIDADGDDLTYPLSPGDPSRGIYGQGFRVRFREGFGVADAATSSQPNPPYFVADEERILDYVKEVDLLDPTKEKSSSEANWVCPAEMRFLIVRPEDNGDRVFCGMNAGQTQPLEGFVEDATVSMSAAEDVNRYLARQVLPIEYWHIDYERQCIVAKDPKDECYSEDRVYKDVDNPEDAQPVNYLYSVPQDIDESLLTPAQVQQRNEDRSCGEDNDSVCPHYVSICYKTNTQ